MGGKQVAYPVQCAGAHLLRRGDAVTARRDEVDERLRSQVTRPLDLLPLDIGERLWQRHLVVERIVLAADDAAQILDPAQPFVTAVPHPSEPTPRPPPRAPS